MGLSNKEASMLERLMKKKDEPDAPAGARNINVSIDLGDDKQVERAQRLGLLGMLNDDDDDGDDGDDGEDGEETPKRRGYFT